MASGKETKRWTTTTSHVEKLRWRDRRDVVADGRAWFAMEARRCGGMGWRRRGRTGEVLPRKESKRSQCKEMERTTFLLSPPHDLASNSTISTFDMHSPFFPDTHPARRNKGWISMAINTLLFGIFVRLPMQMHQTSHAPSIL